MKVNDQLHVFELPLNFGGVERRMSVSLIVDPHHGLTLVDTGLPGQAEFITAAIENEGLSIEDVKQIVITHQDMDHVGSLHALKEKTGATVFAYCDEIPYIDGTLTPVKWPSPERLAQMPELAERLKLLIPTQVDEAVQDGQTLPRSAGAVAIATPGHTPGHMSLYLPETKTLITGDAMVSEAGVLNGPNEGATPDLNRARESVKKLAELDVETIVCYHGGLVTEDASGQLKRVALTANATP